MKSLLLAILQGDWQPSHGAEKTISGKRGDYVWSVLYRRSVAKRRSPAENDHWETGDYVWSLYCTGDACKETISCKKMISGKQGDYVWSVLYRRSVAQRRSHAENDQWKTGRLGMDRTVQDITSREEISGKKTIIGKRLDYVWSLLYRRSVAKRRSPARKRLVETGRLCMEFTL
jgi:hypothetical protein